MAFLTMNRISCIKSYLKLLTFREIKVLRLCRKCSLPPHFQSKYDVQNHPEKTTYFITTPIFYVNAAPHMGHLYSCLLADAAARWHRLQGHTVLFSTGTDEHGLKIQQAAEKQKQSPEEFVTQVSASFKTMCDSYDISYTDYIRTTQDRHKQTVLRIWEKLADQGYIYKGKYSGWYSVSDEAFLGTEDVADQTLPDGSVTKVSVESGQPAVWMEEDNYMFALSRFREPLTEWLDTGAVQPACFERVLRVYVDNLCDLSVSRQTSRMSWGIDVPGDPTQKIYVWLDALLNYLTASGYPDDQYVWPADCHVVGKDILRFHAVYWPAFLMAAGLPPPTKVFCHSHWLVNGEKMSKSRGNVVDPMAERHKYSADVFRYFLLREGVPHSDGNYMESVGMEYVNADIANTLGNLLSRCTAASVNPEQIYPRRDDDAYHAHFTAADRETFDNLVTLVGVVNDFYRDLLFSRGIHSIMSYLRWTNGLIDEHKTWVLAKSSSQTDKAHLKTVFHMALETLRVSGILLQPVVPTFSDRLLNRLGIPADKRTIEHARKPYLNCPNDQPLGPNEGVILKRIKINK